MKNSENTENIDSSNLIHIQRACQWRAAFFGLLILIAGIAIGAASIMIFAPDKLIQDTSEAEFGALRLMPSLRRNLGLSQSQANEIRPVLNQHMESLNEIREDARIDIAAVLTEMDEDVSILLNERQKGIWQRELLRLQQQLNPRPLRQGRGQGQGRGQQQGGGAGQRRGMGRGFLQNQTDSSTGDMNDN